MPFQMKFRNDCYWVLLSWIKKKNQRRCVISTYKTGLNVSRHVVEWLAVSFCKQTHALLSPGRKINTSFPWVVASQGGQDQEYIFFLWCRRDLIFLTQSLFHLFLYTLNLIAEDLGGGSNRGRFYYKRAIYQGHRHVPVFEVSDPSLTFTQLGADETHIENLLACTAGERGGGWRISASVCQTTHFLQPSWVTHVRRSAAQRHCC